MTSDKVYVVGYNRRITLRDAQVGNHYIQRLCHDGTITLLPVTVNVPGEGKAAEETGWHVDKSPADKESCGEIETEEKKAVD